MLDDTLKTQLKAYLERVTQPFEIEASLSDSESSRELQQLLQDIAAMSDKITLKLDGQDARRPSFSLKRRAGDASVAAPIAIGTGERVAASAAPGGIAASAQVAFACVPAHAAEDRGGHGVSADCGEPWQKESRKMAAALGGNTLNATESQQAFGDTLLGLQQELSQAEDEIAARDL
jgi:hypothetical protein